jgi:hypothetical protein
MRKKIAVCPGKNAGLVDGEIEDHVLSVLYSFKRFLVYNAVVCCVVLCFGCLCFGCLLLEKWPVYSLGLVHCW